MHLTCDVVLLTDVFEKIIISCLEYYGLNLTYYVSSIALIWDEMFKIAEDIDIYQFAGKEIRCGISSIAQRYSKASNDFIVTYCKFTHCLLLVANSLAAHYYL